MLSNPCRCAPLRGQLAHQQHRPCHALVRTPPRATSKGCPADAGAQRAPYLVHAGVRPLHPPSRRPPPGSRPAALFCLPHHRLGVHLPCAAAPTSMLCAMATARGPLACTHPTSLVPGPAGNGHASRAHVVARVSPSSLHSTCPLPRSNTRPHTSSSSRDMPTAGVSSPHHINPRRYPRPHAPHLNITTSPAPTPRSAPWLLPCDTRASVPVGVQAPTQQF